MKALTRSPAAYIVALVSSFFSSPGLHDSISHLRFRRPPQQLEAHEPKPPGISFFTTIRGFDSVTIIKFIAILILFVPQWGVLWHSPNRSIELAVEASGVTKIAWFDQLEYFYLSRGLWRNFIVYSVVYIFCLVALLTTPFIRSYIVRMALVILVFLAGGIELVILELTGTFSDSNMLMPLWGERALATSTMVMYRKEIVANGLLLLPVVLGILITPSKKFSLPGRFAAVSGPCGGLWYYFILERKRAAVPHSDGIYC